MKSRILRALNRTEGYVSGQELCDELNVSRTAVWKVINQLKEEGYEVESVPRKGYRILARPDVITAEETGSRMTTGWVGRHLCYSKKTGSTNADASRIAADGAVEGMLVLAEEQTNGKGRRGRSWTTPPGSAIAMSLILRPQILPSHASMITLLMGMAVTKACCSFCGIKAGIKWPNDVVVNGKKICGILTEMISEVDYIKYVIVGIGINTSVDSFPYELSETAASLHTFMGEKPDRAGLIAEIMKAFEIYYGIFLKTQDFSTLCDEYNAMLVGRGGKVKVLESSNEYEGISEGINSKGELKVRRENGVLESVYAGEVSVRGVYGYV